MNSKILRILLSLILLSLAVLAGLALGSLIHPPAAAANTSAVEQPLTLLTLAGPAAEAQAEISGLAWFGDTLILLPQYPERFGEGDGALFALSKQEILDALDGKNSQPLSPRAVKFSAPGLKESIRDYQGYEAIGFHENQVYLTIEAGQGLDMHGYLVKGVSGADLGAIELQSDSLVEIALPIQSDNHSDEALLVSGDRVLTFYELNGTGLNPQPAAQVFDLDLRPLPALPLAALEYRLTDATLAADGSVWVLNYFFPGDTDMLPKSDPLAAAYGEGPTHSRYDQVERLVALDLSETGLTLRQSAPLQLQLVEDARNWEGLVELPGRGFLLATDKFPGTLLGFVPYP